MQLHGKDDQQSPAKYNLKISEEHPQPVSDNDVEDNMVPVVVRPGHIRFEPLEKGLHSIFLVLVLQALLGDIRGS